MDHEETDQVNEEVVAPASPPLEGLTATAQPLVNTEYLKHYKRHVSQFKQHLRGADDINGSLPPSVISLGAYWTQEEKNLFFHALSVHSRHHLELIAAEIPGKSIVDVCSYLEALSIASLEHKRRLSRQAFPPASEVSDKWICFEEEQADAMTFYGAIWDQEYRDERRTMALKDEREAMRKYKEKYTGSDRDRQGEKRRRTAFDEFRVTQETQWRREDYLSALDGPHLRVLDNILREAEEPLSPMAYENEDHDRQPEDPIINRVDISDSMIDPVLLSIPSAAAKFDTTEPVPSTVHANIQTFKPIGENEESDLSKLSPRSKRRYKKRLHMRRKRAEASGGRVLTSLAKLKPGRKPSTKRASLSTQSSRLELSGPDAHNIDGAVVNQDLHVRKEEQGAEQLENLVVVNDDSFLEFAEVHGDEVLKKSSGLTLPYKIKHHLLSNEINASYLNVSGLGLFHLSSIERLMNLNSTLMGDLESSTSYISSATIRLLQAEVTLFLAKLMQLAIAIHQQQRRQKAQTRAWNLSTDQIGAPTIEEAIDAMGIQSDKRAYFETVITELPIPEEEEEAELEAHSSDSEESVSTNRSSDSTAEPLISFSASQEICVPFVWQGSSETLQRPFHRSLSQASETPIEVESLDENIEADELLDEEVLDHRDMEMSLDAESELWRKYTGIGEAAAVDTESAEKLEPDESRTIRYRQTSGVKSKAFIEDSD